jgi:aspartyl protease family protein
MLRNLLLMGVSAAFAIAIPLLYESNPALFQSPSKPQAESEDAAAAGSRPAMIQPTMSEPEVLIGRKVRLSADSRGHFVAEFKLNGRPVEALIDTGATTVAINRSTARRIGINLVPADFVYRVNTANGTTKAAAATIAQMQLGRIYLENVEAAVLDDSALQTTLIGMSFLKRLDKFQVESGALLLAQ